MIAERKVDNFSRIINEAGDLKLATPGSYWKEVSEFAGHHWRCVTPNGLMGNLRSHTVIETPKGIVVQPSIKITSHDKMFHGYLIEDVWTYCSDMTVRGHYRHNYGDLTEPGDFRFARDIRGKICNLFYVCPCGCGRTGALDIDLKKDPNSTRQWKWSGSHRFPTLEPSIFANQSCQYHGYLKNGIWTFC